MTLWDFADRHWFIALLAVLFLGTTLSNITRAMRRAAKRHRDS